ncbi:MAG: beta-propeller domain-containing protein, partial [Deltaproteobacteria bacterium]|nr:beta-propeller domain-containing protein [Deltaproteobacteria bacterium]
MKTERSANALAARKISTAGIAAIACAAILVVAPPGDATAARVFPSLQRAGSCAVVRGAIADAVADRAYQRLLRSRRHRHYRLRERLSRRKSRAGGRPMKRAMPMASAESPTDAARGPSHHTGTNNQVADVHEADQVKTDGKTIYAIAGREVLIIKSWPVSATRVLSRYRVGSGETPTSLFVHGKRLVVISRHRTTRGGSSLRCRHTTKGFRRPHRCAPHNVYTTRVSVIDVADRRNPRALAHVDLDGRLLSARRIGREMAFVTSAPLHIPRKIWSDLRHVQSPKRSQGPRHRYFYRWDGMGRPHRVTPPKTPPTAHQPASWSNLRRRALQALRATPIVDILPHATFFSASGGKLASRTMQRCGEIFVPRETAGLNLLSVTRLSLDGGRVASAGVLASG